MLQNENHSSSETSQVEPPDDTKKDSKAVSRSEEARLLRELQTEGSMEDAPCYLTREYVKWRSFDTGVVGGGRSGVVTPISKT